MLKVESDFINYVDGDYWDVMTDAEKCNFMRELTRELQDHHPLWGIDVLPLTKCNSSDDYMALLPNNQVAIIHLTWSRRPELPGCPSFEILPSIEASRSYF